MGLVDEAGNIGLVVYLIGVVLFSLIFFKGLMISLLVAETFLNHMGDLVQVILGEIKQSRDQIICLKSFMDFRMVLLVRHNVFLSI